MSKYWIPIDSIQRYLLTFFVIMVNKSLCPRQGARGQEDLVHIERIRRMVLASLMASFAAVGSYIHIPIGPVPIVLTNLFVFLSGLLLGSRWGLASIGLYLMVGAMGMPVFAGGKGGLAHFLGPTGGYLLGYAFSAWIVGFLSERSRGFLAVEIIAVGAGVIAIYALGIPWLKWVTQLSWAKALVLGMAPFLVGDAVKASAALALARAVRPMLDRQRPASP
jgi:biotin transport system substrate-specific component